MYKTSTYGLLVISVRSLALISQIWLKYFKIQDKYIVRTLCSLIITFISSLLFNFASSFCSEITFMNHEISWSTIFDPSTEKVINCFNFEQFSSFIKRSIQSPYSYICMEMVLHSKLQLPIIFQKFAKLCLQLQECYT